MEEAERGVASVHLQTGAWLQSTCACQQCVTCTWLVNSTYIPFYFLTFPLIPVEIPVHIGTRQNSSRIMIACRENTSVEVLKESKSNLCLLVPSHSCLVTSTQVLCFGFVGEQKQKCQQTINQWAWRDCPPGLVNCWIWGVGREGGQCKNENMIQCENTMEEYS